MSQLYRVKWAAMMDCLGYARKKFVISFDAAIANEGDINSAALRNGILLFRESSCLLFHHRLN